MTEITYIPATLPNAGAIPQGTQIATHARASDNATVQDVYAEQLTDGTQITKVLFDASNMSAFGTLETAELTPIIQTDFVYGLNTQIWQTATVSGTGATVDTNTARLRVQSGTGSANYAYILSRRPVRYRAGQGTVARFTTVFTAGVANNIQIMGMGTIVTNAPYDGFFFGYNGTDFGIVHYNRGTPTWTNQADWNGDKCDGSTGSAFTWNPAMGIPVMIKYPYLGYGDIEFYAQTPTTSRWTLCHVIRYANTTTTTELSNPTLNFMAFTLNSGNTTNQTMYCGSVGVFLSGVRSFIGNPKEAADNNKSTITTETNLLSIRNCTTYNGTANRGLIRLNSVSFGSSSATGVAVMRFKIGATLGGTPSFAAKDGTTADAGVTITNGNSISSVDTAGTTVTGGTYIYNLTTINGGITMDLTPYEIYIAPSETLTISGFSSVSSTLGVSVNWTEDI